MIERVVSPVLFIMGVVFTYLCISNLMNPWCAAGCAVFCLISAILLSGTDGPER